MSRRVAMGAGLVAALTLLVVLANVIGASGKSQPTELLDGPVVALSENWNAYPAAQVTGRLELVDGCLLIEDVVVFWPAGTSWEADTEAVSFGGDFADAAEVQVGEVFSGGGGFYSDGDLDVGGLDVDALRACLRVTDVDGVVFAYPG